MATHRKKVVEVEARKYMGPANLSVMHDFKGQQSAKKGDWLVGNEKGKIEVVSDADFQQQYEPIGDESGTTREWSLGTTVPVMNHPFVETLLKGSTDDAPLHEATVPGETLDSDGTLGDHEVPVADLGNVDEVKAVGETAKVKDAEGNVHELNNADGQLDTTTHQDNVPAQEQIDDRLAQERARHESQE